MEDDGKLGEWEILQPQKLEERVAAAKKLRGWFETDAPYYIDLMDDNARLAYGAWPERLAIIEDGKLAFYGGPGPFEYFPEKVEAWLSEKFGPGPRM